jgi:hypothetical protein
MGYALLQKEPAAQSLRIVDDPGGGFVDRSPDRD